MKAIVLVHGGAGLIPDSRVHRKLQGVQKAVLAGCKTLLKEENGLNAVCSAVASMEDDPVMNAGFGSVLDEDGKVSMDAAICEGKNLQSGGILGVERVKNPIWLAEKVLEHSPHCLLACEGAQRFALSQGIGLVPHESLISPDAQRAWEQFKKTPKNLDDQLLSTIEGVSNELESHDTVGAVCMDFQGNLFAGTSTGGLNGKAKGRIGDSPINGAGLFADNNLAAVSTTGQGEALYRGLVAVRIAEKIGNNSTHDGNEVIEKVLEDMTSRIGGDGGAICIDKRGKISIGWNSKRMSWAYSILDIGCSTIEVHFGCNAGEHFTEYLRLTES